MKKHLFLILFCLSLTGKNRAEVISDSLLDYSLKRSIDYFESLGKSATYPDVIQKISVFKKEYGLDIRFPDPLEFTNLDAPYRQFLVMYYRESGFGAKLLTQEDVELLHTDDHILRLEAYSYLCGRVPLPEKYIDELIELSKHGGLYENYAYMTLYRTAERGCLIKNEGYIKAHDKMLSDLKILLTYPDLVGCTPILNRNQTVFSLLSSGNHNSVSDKEINDIIHAQLQNGGWGMTAEQRADEFSSLYGMLSIFWYKKFVVHH